MRGSFGAKTDGTEKKLGEPGNPKAKTTNMFSDTGTFQTPAALFHDSHHELDQPGEPSKGALDISWTQCNVTETCCWGLIRDPTAIRQPSNVIRAPRCRPQRPHPILAPPRRTTYMQNSGSTAAPRRVPQRPHPTVAPWVGGCVSA